MLKRLALTLVIVFIAREGLAGTLVRATVQALDPSATPGEVTMYLEPDRVRVDFKNEDMHQAIIYSRDGDKSVLRVVDENLWTYRELKHKDVDKARGLAADELEVMEQEIRKLPSDERDATRTHLRHSLGRLHDIVEPRDGAQFAYKVRAEQQRVHKWKADSYEAYYEDELDGICDVAAWEDVGISREDVQVLIDMREAFGDIALDLAFVTLWSNDIAGYPVRVETYTNGVLMEITHLREVAHGNFDSGIFELTKDYDRHSFFESKGGGAGMYGVVGGSSMSAASAVHQANLDCKKPQMGQ